ncbi:MAG: NusG domain II-containing protein, partial [Clostridia bacterium]|nr:NusG domain II-containing protein [Clostridia bacterium]
NGGTNLLIIKDGKAYISEATCPDLVCVHTGHADELKSIVCLPNRVTVSIEK